MKKLHLACIAIIAVLALVYGALIANRVTSSPNTPQVTGTSSPIIEETVQRIDSESAYASLLITKAGLTSEQAAVRAEQVFSEMNTDTSGSGIDATSLYFFNKTVYPDRFCKEKGWSAEYGFSATITDNAEPVFVDITDTWQTAGESGDYTYEKVSPVNVNKLNDTQVQLSGLGKLQAENKSAATGEIESYYRIDANINTVIEANQATE